MKAPAKYSQWIGLAAGLIILSHSPVTLAAFGGASHAPLSVRADAEGTHGGNGDGSLTDEMNDEITSIGIVNMDLATQPTLNLWCDNIYAYLESKVDDANEAINGAATPAQLERAVNILRKALIVAEHTMHNDGRRHTLITQKMIKRGVEMTAALDHVVATNVDPAIVNTELTFLTSYIELIRDIAQNFDRQLYIPQFYNPALSVEGLQARYLDYARRQLAYVNGEFTRYLSGQSDAGRCVEGLYTQGPYDVYLTLASLITQYVAEDLEFGAREFKYANACLINDLKMYHGRIQGILKEIAASPGSTNVAKDINKVRDWLQGSGERIVSPVCSESAAAPAPQPAGHPHLNR